MSKSTIVYDSDGNPLHLMDSDVLLAATEAPVEVDPDVPALERSVKPEDVGWDEWQRRQDRVSSIAREYDAAEPADIKDFLKGQTTRDLTDDDVAQLHHDITSHRVGDITDVLDGQLRSTMDELKRGRRTVRVVAPKGWLKRAFNNLDQKGVEQVVARLTSRGHDTNTIKDRVVSRVSSEDTRKDITDKLESGELKVEG